MYFYAFFWKSPFCNHDKYLVTVFYPYISKQLIVTDACRAAVHKACIADAYQQ